MSTKKYDKKINFLLPTLAVSHLQSCITTNQPTFDYQIESFYGIFWDILTQQDDVDEKGLVCLYSGILKAKYDNYRPYLDYLIANNIILTDGQYIVDEKSRAYGFINENLIQFGFTEVAISTKSNAGRYITNRFNAESSSAKDAKDYIRQLRKDYKSITFDYERAYQYMKDRAIEFNVNETYSAMVTIHKLKNRNNKLLYFKRNRTNNRVDTNLTSLPSYLKQFITSFEFGIQIDLKNSQPVLFNILLNHIHLSINNSSYKLLENIIKTLPLCCVNNDIISSINLISKEIKKNRKWVERLLEEISIYRQETMNGTWYEYLIEIYNM